MARGTLVLSIVAAACMLVAMPRETHAAVSTLKVSPVRSDIEVKPGMTKTIRTTVTNLTGEPMTIRPVGNDFVAGDERGTPALILDGREFAPSHSLKKFMDPFDDVTIAPKEAKTVTVIIRVPTSAQPGGYFGAVRFAPVSPAHGGQVNISPSAASLILLRVTGKAPEKLLLTDFSLVQNGKTPPFLPNGGNVLLTARFQNQGNVQAGPFGKVSVKKGDEVVYETDFNPTDPREVVLPGSARRWDTPLKGIEGFGKYTVSAVFTYGKDNQTIEASKSFWVVPPVMIIAGIVGVLGVIGGGFAIGVGIRKRRVSKQKSSRPATFRRYR